MNACELTLAELTQVKNRYCKTRSMKDAAMSSERSRSSSPSQLGIVEDHRRHMVLGKTHCPIEVPRQAPYSKPKSSTAEPKKVSEIKCLNPFENKKTEWLVTVDVLRIDRSRWFASCKKCLKTTRPHGNTYRCTELSCNNIGAPNPRYKLVITAGDETGDAEFVMFGRVAQRLIKKTVDTLLADNPPDFIPDFIPDEITNLLEKRFTLNVSFTGNTIPSNNISFQVNGIVAEIKNGNPLLLTPAGSQTSATMLSQGASSSAKSTPTEDFSLTLSSPSTGSAAALASPTTPSMPNILDAELPATPESKALVQASKKDLTGEVVPPANSAAPPSYSVLQTQQSATKKRSRASPTKKPTKKLFIDDNARKDEEAGCAKTRAAPRSSDDEV